jgi:UDP-N-acetylmuramate dehydrogenase
VVTPSDTLRALADALGHRATLMRPLGPLTTYGVGGPAALFVEVEDEDDLSAVRRSLRDTLEGSSPRDDRVPTFVIGRGSNLLVSDAGFDGLVLHLGAGFAGLELPATADGGRPGAAPAAGAAQVVRAGAALALPVLARRVADAGWSGLSWAVGVPGSVGGAVRMNAGGHGSDMASCLVRYTWVELFTDGGGTDAVSRLAYGYRSSSVRATELVVAAELEVTPGSIEGEQEAVAAIVRWRREHQPGGSNAGSVFTNPEDDSAGRLIESAGLKGFRIGTAHVSEKHANFIQADRDGRADDVHALMEHVRRVVAERCGVTLRTEVRLLGFDDGKTGPVPENQLRATEAPRRDQGHSANGGRR